MKRILIAFVVTLLITQITQAQGTVYLSNLDQPSDGSLAIGSDSWLAAGFVTGNNPGGYVLDSVQLGMADASGSPSGFAVMLCAPVLGGIAPGDSLGTLDGSLNPVSSGTYAYTPASDITLSPHTPYFIVLTSGTAVVSGAYNWSYVTANSYNPNGGWASFGDIWTSSNGSFLATPTAGDLQFAINASAVPEPGVLSLLGLGGLLFVRHRRKI